MAASSPSSIVISRQVNHLPAWWKHRALANACRVNPSTSKAFETGAGFIRFAGYCEQPVRVTISFRARFLGREIVFHCRRLCRGQCCETVGQHRSRMQGIFSQQVRQSRRQSLGSGKGVDAESQALGERSSDADRHRFQSPGGEKAYRYFRKTPFCRRRTDHDITRGGKGKPASDGESMNGSKNWPWVSSHGSRQTTAVLFKSGSLLGAHAGQVRKVAAGAKTSPFAGDYNCAGGQGIR